MAQATNYGDNRSDAMEEIAELAPYANTHMGEYTGDIHE